MSESEQKRPEWMSSISANVDPNEYLSGRKIDKTFELSQQEKADRAKEIRANLIASDKLKITGDPMLDLERRKHQLKLEIISNPIRLRQFRERLLQERRRREGSTRLPIEGSTSNSRYQYRRRSNSRSPHRSSQSHYHRHGSHRDNRRHERTHTSPVTSFDRERQHSTRDDYERLRSDDRRRAERRSRGSPSRSHRSSGSTRRDDRRM